MELRATTQAELEAILARDDLNFDDFEIVIDSPRGVRLTISDGRRLDVRAFGSATVEAYDSATVEAYGSATVRASGSATVRASDSATVRAFGSATVRAGKYVAIHLFSQRVTLHGGVLIDMTAIDRRDPATWCDLHGVEVDSDGMAHLFKAVDSDLYAGHQHVKTQYVIGGDPECDVWRDDHGCGAGLHACPTAWLAKDHCRKATRFLEVTVPVGDLRPIGDTKAKARTVHVLREVDLNMKQVEATK